MESEVRYGQEKEVVCSRQGKSQDQEQNRGEISERG